MPQSSTSSVGKGLTERIIMVLLFRNTRLFVTFTILCCCVFAALPLEARAAVETEFGLVYQEARCPDYVWRERNARTLQAGYSGLQSDGLPAGERIDCPAELALPVALRLVLPVARDSFVFGLQRFSLHQSDISDAYVRAGGYGVRDFRDNELEWTEEQIMTRTVRGVAILKLGFALRQFRQAFSFRDQSGPGFQVSEYRFVHALTAPVYSIGVDLQAGEAGTLMLGFSRMPTATGTASFSELEIRTTGAGAGLQARLDLYAPRRAIRSDRLVLGFRIEVFDMQVFFGFDREFFRVRSHAHVPVLSVSLSPTSVTVPERALSEDSFFRDRQSFRVGHFRVSATWLLEIDP